MKMSPLLIVGMMIATSTLPVLSTPEADVKTKCQNDPACYWWMGQDSPFKFASQKGAHVKNSYNINPNNPFLNGQQPSNNVDFNKNPFLNNQNNVFPTAQPALEPTQGGQHYAQNPFLQNMFIANGSQVSNEGFIGVQPKPFSLQNQGKFEDDDFVLTPSSYTQRCQGDDSICVPNDQCVNGVLPDYISNGLRGVKRTDEPCDLRNNACCRITKSIDQSREVKVLVPDFNFANNTYVTSGKTSIPDSLIKFGGLPGFSPGTIQILPVEINNAGEFGSSNTGESTQKPTRDIAPTRRNTNNNLFGVTPDYSNVNFEDVRFASSIQGPAYLPPKIGPVVPSPSSAIPNLEVPVSTYVPSFPTTKQPSIYRPSVNNQYVTPKPKPFVPEYLPPSTPAPYRPPTYRPLPSPSSPFPSQRPYNPPTTQFRPQPSPSSPYPSQRPYNPTLPPFKPSADREYLPPIVPTSSSNVNNQYRPFPSTTTPRPSTLRPRPPPTFIPPTSKVEYLPPSPSSYKPKPTVIYQTSPSITPGYTYSKPTPGYTYPKPTPSFSYPTTPKPTVRPLLPSSSFNVPVTSSTPGNTYPRPSSTQGYTYTRPSSTSPTPGYSYPKPTPEFKLPEASNVATSVRPRPTTSYLPPSTTPGYVYPKPTPTFGYPDRDGASGNQNNQYIPPPQPDKDGSDTSDTSVKVRPTRPDVRPDQSGINENAVPPSGCAAALKCVQEIYCTAEGVVSPVPVVLTNEQAQNRVPTTVCRDVSSGTTGVCCRDPNYKDPWPSANLVNGFDDGQYKEDASLGQYKESLNDIARYRPEFARPQRSNRRRTVPVKQALQNFGPNENLRGQEQETCGVRHENTSPKGPGPLNTNFAEIPWQAMILRDSNRSLLCGGAIIKRNVVLTTAHCVEGIQTSDLLVKGGEWKLGIDEEPLPFQIVKVAVIVKHPGYKSGSLVNDLAVLILEEKLRPANNIGTICLPEPNKIPTRNCIATGWGKRILQLHAKGAIMRAIDISIMDNEQCRETLGSAYQEMMPNYSPNTLCGFSGKDQCKVDYGSALACSNEDNKYVLSGIFSWDTGCKDQNQIGGFIAPDVEWINECLSKPVKVLRKLPNAL